MLYLFRAADGTLLEREYPVGKAPLIGKSIRVGGIRYTRVPSLGATAIPNNIDHMTSVQLPLKWKYAKSWDAKGQPRFQNMGEVREAMARANHDGERVGWD